LILASAFAQLAENTYRLEEGFLCGPISFGDVIETEPTDQEKVLLFRRRIRKVFLDENATVFLID